MALDISKLREKLSELKGNAAKADVLWKPAEGENQIRIVPLKDTPDNPFIELYFIYLGGKTYLSPMSFGEPDPIAEFAETLRAGGGLSKEDWAETKKFVPQRRTFVPVIDRKKPELGVRFWAFGKTVYSELLNVMADPDYGDITDPQTGRDIKVVFTPKEKSDTNFAKTAVRVSPKQTPLTKNSEELQTWLSNQPDLYAVHKRMSYDELKEVLEKFINGGSTSSTPAARTVTTTGSDDWDTPSPTAAKSQTNSAKLTADVEDEFSKLFEKD